MKSFESLTNLGRIRRIRNLAVAALKEYNVTDTNLRFCKYAGNYLYRVSAAKSKASKIDDKLFVDGQYLLRVHHPGYQTTDAILLELNWLNALRHDIGAPVPEPVANRKGTLVTNVKISGIPVTRICSLLRWVRGRLIVRGIRPRHYRAQGKLMGLLHGHASKWLVLDKHDKRTYDWHGLFQADSGSGLPAQKVWPMLPSTIEEPFRVVTKRVQRVMDDWGKSADVYGLIHADLGVDANVLFWKNEVRAIDFDDSGLGYYIYDLAVALEHCWEETEYPRYRDALLDGYAENRSLSRKQYESIDCFIAAFQIYWYLWARAIIHLHPAQKKNLSERMKRAVRIVKRYLRENKKGIK